MVLVPTSHPVGPASFRLGKLALVATIAAFVSGCDGRSSRPVALRQHLTDEELAFLSDASGVDRLMSDGRIDYGELLEIHNMHKQWRLERGNLPSYNIGFHSDIVRQKLGTQRHLNQEDLRGHDLRWANLTGAALNGSNLSGTGIRATPVTAASGTNRPHKLGIDLSNANLVGAEVRGASGTESLLRYSLLIGTDFSKSDLSGAVLRGADVRWATIQESDLSDADFQFARVAGTVYEPKPSALPNVSQMAYADGLHQLTYLETPAALVELRNAFHLAGFERQARQVTYAIRRTERLELWNGNNVSTKVESIAALVFFEVTSAYGMAPYRPILMLLLAIPMFSLVYSLAILGYGNGRIWANRPNFAVNKKVLRKWVRVEFRRDRRSFAEISRVMRIAGCFSTLCAFRIGFREFSVGDWISRLQSRQYELRATGWARSVAGCQALISLYLLALSILCFLGRPFG